MTPVSKISSWLFNGKGESIDSRPSWNWQAPTPFYSSVHKLEGPPPEELPNSSQSATERPNSVQSNCITKTTVYDPQTGGFIISVSTDTSDHALPVLQCSPVDKLILSQNSYNTLTRKMKSSDSYSTLPHPQPLAIKERLARTDSRGTVSGSLINQSPHYVTSIAVVSSCGSLLTLSSSADATSDRSDTEDSDEEDNVEDVNNRIQERQAPYIVNANNEFVANIHFGSITQKRDSRDSKDSLVTNTLLDFTRPRQEEQKRKAKLSGFILDEEGENSFENQMDLKEAEVFSNEPKSDDFEQSHLSATVLDKGDELNDLYRTISRKRILSKVHCSNFHLHNTGDSHHGECNRKHSNLFGDQRTSPEESPNPPNQRNPQTPNPRPLAKILDRLHSVNPNENTYVSLTGDSVYQSLQNQNPMSDTNNNGNKHPHEVLSACPVLVKNILATHAETFRHATSSGCADCFDYANSVGYALPYLEPRPYPEEGQCRIHRHDLSAPGGLSLSDIEKGMMQRASHYKHNEVNRRKESKIICYLAAVILAILVLIAVIVVLTMMVANKEMGKEISF